MDESNRKRFRFIAENISAFLVAVFFILAGRSSLLEFYKIPSGSMVPTLLRGDHIFVNKMAYQLKVPFTEWFSKPITLGQKTNPARGDVVVFVSPKDADSHFIKRIVGVPGDTIEIKSKVIFVDSKPIVRKKLTTEASTQILSQVNDGTFSENYIDLYYEALGTENHLILLDRNNFVSENMARTQVPADHYFVMGDNRDFSNDSRFWGFVPFQNIRGKAAYIWFSFWRDPWTLRTARIGTPVQ